MTALAVISCILGSVGIIVFVIMLESTLNLNGCLVVLLIYLPFIGGYIGGNIYVGTEFGALGVAIGNLVGIILGIIAIIKMGSGGIKCIPYFIYTLIYLSVYITRIATPESSIRREKWIEVI